MFSLILGAPSNHKKSRSPYVTVLHGHSLSWTSLGRELGLQARKHLSWTRSSKAFGLNANFCRCFYILLAFLFLATVSDGAGLFCGVLKHLLDRGSSCPKVLAATHFHEVFRTDLFDFESVPVTFLHMQVMFTTTNGVLSTDSNGSALQNRIENICLTPQPQQEGDESQRVGLGERITYLYRCVAAAYIYLRLMAHFPIKGCQRPFARFARRTVRRNLWHTTACSRKSSIRHVSRTTEGVTLNFSLNILVVTF